MWKGAQSGCLKRRLPASREVTGSSCCCTSELVVWQSPHQPWMACEGRQKWMRKLGCEAVVVGKLSHQGWWTNCHTRVGRKNITVLWQGTSRPTCNRSPWSRVEWLTDHARQEWSPSLLPPGWAGREADPWEHFEAESDRNKILNWLRNPQTGPSSSEMIRLIFYIGQNRSSREKIRLSWKKKLHFSYLRL